MVSRSPLAAARARPVGAALVLVLVAGFAFQVATLLSRDIDAWGWDESTHAELPAARLVLAGSAREVFQVVNDCDQYPAAFPVYLAAVQALVGIGQGAARGAAWLLWVLGGLVGLACLGRCLARRLALPGELALALPALAFLSPLVWRHAPSLFLEVPFLVVATWTLVAWLARQGSSAGWSRRRELTAGVLVTAAFFTKFNYGGQLGLALALDWLLETLGEVRARRWRAQLTRSAWLAAPAAAAFLWWFVLPWPGGVIEGEAHWRTFVAFLGGNLQASPTPWAQRALHWATGACAHPGWLVGVALALGAALLRRTVTEAGLPPAMRCLWLVLILLVVPPAVHPFHLDRLLIPGLLPLWALAAVGASGWIARPRRLAALVLAATLAWLVLPNHLLAARLGLLSADPEVRARQVRVIDRDWSLGGRVATAGLSRATHDALAEVIAAAVRPGERVAWIGMSTEFSRAALHLALLERTGEVARFRRDAHVRMDVRPAPGSALPADPDAELARIAASFDVVLLSTPADLKHRPQPGFYERWQAPMVTRLGWSPAEIGRIAVERDGAAPVEIILFVLRPPGDG